ncbi:hypothetical protein CYMTET_36713 [Cymbomonas tetramitiformis]|uniref:Uncharacterized protein n=1 Tax=Cymbomonas tetramitiformis TaxID=36881 RepID=A0AAE0CFD9_9CHLO|nr:hypothetical protein CYMTET_36713 [Cymbomonas tetramitiformis]
MLQLLPMYPLANQTKHLEDAGVEWTEQERETLGIGLEDQEREEGDMMAERNPPGRTKRNTLQRDTGKWARQEDLMEAPGREGTHTPTRILASRQYLDNYTDMASKVIKYETQWTDSEGNMLRTWSTEETIRTYLLAHTPSSDQGWEDLVDEWKRTKQGKRAERDTWHEEMEAQQMQEDEIEFQQMEQEDEAAQMVAQHTQTLQQEEGGPEPQPIGGRIGEDGDEPTREDQWEVEEVELRRMKEEEITLMHEGQQEHREPQNQQETDHARQDTRMPSQGTEEPQDGQQGIALQVTQEMELPETQDMSMEAQQDEEDDLIEMAQQQEEA